MIKVSMLHARLLRTVLLCTLLAGCVAEPDTDPTADPPDIARSVIVVNEGLWRANNATLTRYDPATGDVVADWFAAANPGMTVGDVANGVAIQGGRIYVAVSTSRSVEVVDAVTGVSQGRLLVGMPNDVRAVAVPDSAHGYISTFGDTLFAFDPHTLTVTRSRPVGPAPEGVAADGGWVAVANSGLGSLRQDEPEAGTVWLLDSGTLRLRVSIAVGVNPRVLRVDRSSGRLYVLYGLPERTGGVVEIDPVAGRLLRRWSVEDARDMALDEREGIIYAIGTGGVIRLPLDAYASPSLHIDTTGTGGLFYSIGVEPASGDLYVGTTRGYQPVAAAVRIYSSTGTFRRIFSCGIYPGEFGFVGSE